MISEYSYNFILDEIIRREMLKYDPSMVFVSNEEEDDNESDSDSGGNSEGE